MFLNKWPKFDCLSQKQNICLPLYTLHVEYDYSENRSTD